MKERVFIVHGWGGSPKDDWIPWAKKELQKRGYQVIIPAMPDTDYPKIETWVPYLAQITGEIDRNTILIGHSIGCQTTLRYLETLPEGQIAGLVICAAGWFKLTLESPEEKEIARPWLETPLNLFKVKTKAASFIAIFSKDDQWVPWKENSEIFKEKLGARIILEENQGHFTKDEGVTELSILLDILGK